MNLVLLRITSNISVIICGDFNCRIGRSNIDNARYALNRNLHRVSFDSTLNSRGKHFVKHFNACQY